MTETLTKVVVDCTTDPSQQAALDLIAEGLDMLRQGDAAGAAKIQQGQDVLDNQSPVNPITVVPLNSEELAQRTADQEAGNAMAITDLKSECDGVLAATDWTQMSDAADRLPAGTTADQWASYRQAVYDRRQQITDPATPPAWPTPPAPLVGLPAPG